MLEWLGERHGNAACIEAGGMIRAAVDRVFVEGLRPFDFGGTDDTTTITQAVLAGIAS